MPIFTENCPICSKIPNPSPAEISFCLHNHILTTEGTLTLEGSWSAADEEQANMRLSNPNAPAN